MIKKHMNFVGFGFTLVEMMVTVAIIVLLVSIVMPSLNRARDIGRNGVCLTNLHAVGRAFQMYLNQSNDVLPKAAGVPSEEPALPTIRDLFKPYIDSEEVFHCPGDRDEPTFFEREGLSYEYFLGYLCSVDDAPTLENNTFFSLIKQKVNVSRIQVMFDLQETFHGWTNILYGDWHVDR